MHDDMSENITFPYTTYVVGNKVVWRNVSDWIMKSLHKICQIIIHESQDL